MNLVMARIVITDLFPAPYLQVLAARLGAFCLSCDHFMSRVFGSDGLVYDHGSSHSEYCGS